MNNESSLPAVAAIGARRLTIAPMLEWTDRHCRYFHRLLSQHAWLYSEMVTTGALLYGETERFLRYSPQEHPLALQLGGSEPDDLARAVALAEPYAYDEINLNCGCPSERVQKGAFGACLMHEPELVARCVQAMRAQTGRPVTVKHRIGIDRVEDYAFVRRFIETVAEAGCRTFIVHARNAWLKGLSPKENRDIPPLRYEVVYQLKQDFPELEILINGGITTLEQMQEHLRYVDGVMIGREAYHNPWWLTEVDAMLYGDAHPRPTRVEVLRQLRDYWAAEMAKGVPLPLMTRHVLGLCQGLRGARRFRQQLSDAPRLRQEGLALIDRVLEEWALRGE